MPFPAPLETTYDAAMPSEKRQPLEIDPQLTLRLSALAERQGETLEDFAANVLREHADQAEQALAEDVEDAERWQRYLKSGTAVPVESVRRRLRELAGAAAEAKRR